MHPLTRLLAIAPEEWLWQHSQNRTSCPAQCNEGLAYTQTERTSWYYPGAWESSPCERCDGRGYLPRVLKLLAEQQRLREAGAPPRKTEPTKPTGR